MKLKTLLKSINESNSTYEYGCAMLYFYLPEVFKIQDAINPQHLYTEEANGGYGLETEPHCTLLYGLHNDVSLNDVKDVLDNVRYGECKGYNPSLFENEKFDVLKFDVGYATRGGSFLHKVNTELSKLPHTTSYPDYHPHLTIAYLKTGYGKRYVDMLKNKNVELKCVPKYAVYSEPNGTKTKIQITIQ